MNRRGDERSDLKLVVAVPAGDALGFRLAGVQVVEVERGHEEAALRGLRAMPGVGVVAVEASLLAAAEGGSRPDPGLPVFIPFTLPRRFTEARGGEAFIAALVRRAVGYHVKLGGPR